MYRSKTKAKHTYKLQEANRQKRKKKKVGENLHFQGIEGKCEDEKNKQKLRLNAKTTGEES